MFGVCFRREREYWEQDQWSYLFSNFGVTEVWERDHKDSEKIYQPVIKVDTAAQLPADRPLVVLAPQDGRFIKGDICLDDFDHPEDAIYLFGGSMANLNDEDDLGGRKIDSCVYIPLVKYECYSHAAGYMVLRDRYTKRNNSFG